MFRHDNFQEKAGIPAFLVKIHAFSFFFMMFWAISTIQVKSLITATEMDVVLCVIKPTI